MYLTFLPKKIAIIKPIKGRKRITIANFISDDDYKSGILVNFVNDDHVFQIYWYDQEHKNEKAYKDFKDIIKTLKFDK